MSSINTATAAAPWLKNKRARFFEPTGPSVSSYAPPTGDPLDTLHSLYDGTPLTATAPPQPAGGGGPKPEITITSFAYAGTIGGTASTPSVSFTVTNDPITSLGFVLYTGTTLDPSTIVAFGDLDVTATSHQYLGATIPNNYYRYSITAINAFGSRTVFSEVLVNAPPPAPSISFLVFNGPYGTDHALPTAGFTCTGVVATLQYTLYGSASYPPTDVVDTNYLSPGATSYTFSGTTVNNFFYRFALTAANTSGSVTVQSDIIANGVVPTVSISSISFAGARGGTASLPTCVFSYGGAPTSLSYTVYGDTSPTPSTAIQTGPISAVTPVSTTFQYTGPTLSGYYYAIAISVTNQVGTNSATSSSLLNEDPPTATITSFTLEGTPGGALALPTAVFSKVGTVTSISYVTYGDATTNPTAIVDSGSLLPNATYYQFSGTTVVNYYYKVKITVGNVTGSTDATTSILQNLTRPTVSITSFTFAGTQGGTSAFPTCAFTTSGTVQSLTYTIYGDSSASPSTVISSGPLSVGATSYQYTGATVANYYYKIMIAVTNTSGTANQTTVILQNFGPPTVSITSISFAGSIGSTSALPTCSFTPSGVIASITYTLYGNTSSNPTTVVSTGSLATSATSYQYLGATVNGYYYKYTITVANAAGSNIATSSILQNVVPWTPTSPASKLVAWFDGTRGVTTTSWTNYANSSLTQGNMTPYFTRPFALTTVNGLQAVTVQYTSNGVEQPTFTANYVNKGRSLFYVYKMSAPLTGSQTNTIGTTVTSLGGLAFNNNPRFSTATSVNQQIVANPATVINFTTNLTSTNNQSSYPTCYGVYSSAVTAADGVFCMNNTKDTPSVNLVVPSTVLNTVTYRLRMGGATATPWTYCEILMYDGELTSSDITSICAYLVTRWGCGAAP